ncbi:uncharacterized protein [Hetaerina americana]|uniref:uncharacterized protein isoform X2 n=1 Tax=Hetaerina americana TaxID=62018 RepID=UPI003A7F3AF2
MPMTNPCEIQCHDKWNILRSVYRRQKRNMEADNSNATKRAKWRWTDRMSFLHEYFNTPMKSSPANRFPSPSEARSPVTMQSPAATPALPADVDPEGVSSPAPPTSMPVAARAPNKAPAVEQPWVGGAGSGIESGWPAVFPEAMHHRQYRRRELRASTLSEELREWLRAKRGVEEVDPFFLSVTRDMRKLSDKDQSMFKIQVQTLLHEFLYPSE